MQIRLQPALPTRISHACARPWRVARSGTPLMMHIISRDPAPLRRSEYVRASGGIFLDMTIHDFDMARFLIGDEVEEIYTAAGVMVDPVIGEAGRPGHGLWC